MKTATAPQRIVVTDGSALMRSVLGSALESAGFAVVGMAADGREALALCRRERPDAMTLGLAMPELDGIGVLRRLRGLGGPEIPVVVVSACSPSQGARVVDALAEGAFDIVTKPVGPGALNAFATELAAKVQLAIASAGARASRNGTPPARPPRPPGGKRLARRVIIAASTGGPRALTQVVPKLPSPLGAGGAIVQHMPAGFTHSLAARLDGVSALSVSEAVAGDRIAPDRLLLAPGGKHLRFGDDGRAVITDEPAIGGLRPRADLTIKDAARLYGERLLLVVMTGMGADGLEGAREVRRRGGRILIQEGSTCAVYGMPRAIDNAGLADSVAALGELPDAIAEEASA